jgi:hypothetical protein
LAETTLITASDIVILMVSEMQDVIQEFKTGILTGLGWNDGSVVPSHDHIHIYRMYFDFIRYPGTWHDTIHPISRLFKHGLTWAYNVPRFEHNGSHLWQHHYTEVSGCSIGMLIKQWIEGVYHQYDNGSLDNDQHRHAVMYVYRGVEHVLELRSKQDGMKAAKLEYCSRKKWKTKFTNTVLQELVCLPGLGSVYQSGIDEIYGPSL